MGPYILQLGHGITCCDCQIDGNMNFVNLLIFQWTEGLEVDIVSDYINF